MGEVWIAQGTRSKVAIEILERYGIDPTPGHAKHSWDEQNDDEVDAMRKLFNELQEKGFRFHRVDKKGEAAEIIEKFDPTIGNMISMPQMAGG